MVKPFYMNKQSCVRAPIRWFQNDLCRIYLWRHGTDCDYDVIADVDNGWGGCIISFRSEMYPWSGCLGSRLILFHFSNDFLFRVMKENNNSCALATSPTKAQPCVTLISTTYRQPLFMTLVADWYRVYNDYWLISAMYNGHWLIYTVYDDHRVIYTANDGHWLIYTQYVLATHWYKTVCNGHLVICTNSLI